MRKIVNKVEEFIKEVVYVLIMSFQFVIIVYWVVLYVLVCYLFRGRIFCSVQFLKGVYYMLNMKGVEESFV